MALAQVLPVLLVLLLPLATVAAANEEGYARGFALQAAAPL